MNSTVAQVILEKLLRIYLTVSAIKFKVKFLACCTLVVTCCVVDAITLPWFTHFFLVYFLVLLHKTPFERSIRV